MLISRGELPPNLPTIAALPPPPSLLPPPGAQLPTSLLAIASMLPPPSALPTLFPTLLNRPGARPLPQPDSDDSDDGPPKKRLLTRDSRDAAGNPAWPPGRYPPELAEPPRLFWNDVVKADFQGQYFEDVKPQVMERWRALSGPEQAAYAARAEELRGQAWDEVETAGLGPARKRFELPGMDDLMEWQHRELRRRAAGSRPRGPAPQGPPTRDSRGWDGEMAWPIHVNVGRFKPFGLFWDEQKARYPGQELRDVWKVDDVAFELRRRFEALGGEERAASEARSEALRQEVWDEREEYERRLARGDMATLPRRLHP